MILKRKVIFNIMEHFRKIKNYENYSVSNYGRIRNDKTGRILKPGDSSTGGYLYVNLYKNGIVKYQKVHRLVALAFIPNPENKRTVNHIDGNKTNNHTENLEWNTHAENNKHAMDNGLLKPVKGSKHYRAKLNENKVLKIRRIFATGEYTKTALGKMFGVSQRLICYVVNRKNWKHI